MKQLIKGMLFLVILVFIACNANDESTLNEENSQKIENYFAKTEDVLKMADFFTEKNEWVLTDVNFLRVEDDSEVEIGKNEIDGLLTFDYYNSKNKELLKTGYFKFKRNKGSESYKLIMNEGASCSGVNCSKCKLKNPWMQDSYCACEKVGHPDGGPSYCNHSTGKVANLNDLTTSKKRITSLIIKDPKFVIREARKRLNK